MNHEQTKEQCALQLAADEIRSLRESVHYMSGRLQMFDDVMTLIKHTRVDYGGMEQRPDPLQLINHCIENPTRQFSHSEIETLQSKVSEFLISAQPEDRIDSQVMMMFNELLGVSTGSGDQV